MRGHWSIAVGCVIGSLLVAGSALADAGIQVPGDITREAENATGAVVTFTATAQDDNDNPIPVECAPPSGSRFPLGETAVECTASYAEDGETTTLTDSFKITVADTTPPTVLVQDVEAEATSDDGAVVQYPPPTVTDAVDPSPTITCSPPPGAFPHGETPVTCTATDDAGNIGSAGFVVRVVDTLGPVFSGVPNGALEREANGPTGSVVTYTQPTATDKGTGEPRPVTCTPPPGALFPLGATEVTCAARDERGNRSEVSFSVLVKDTTAPTLTVPAPLSVTASSAAGAPATDAAVAAFLAGATASDLVTTAPVVAHDAPQVLPVGTTNVTFTATDAAGNVGTASSTVTVFAPATGGQTPPQAPPSVLPVAVPDRTPPGAVRGLRVVAGDKRVRLTWTLPTDPDFDHLSIARSGAATDAREAVTVYTGRGTTFEDRGVRNGVEYRYVLVGYDSEQNTSAAVAAVATPKARLLFAPLDGARVRKPPMLVWRPTAGARYYNVQVFRGRTKIFSGWPTQPRLLLRESWRFGGKQHRLLPGTYRWYVWPGFGARSAARYGAALGQATFVRVRATTP